MNLPLPFVETTRELLGDVEFERFETALAAEAPVTIRVNEAKKRSVPQYQQLVPWATNAYYLAQRPTFTFDPLFHAGCYYVQEASSMFVEQALRHHLPSTAVRALDLCAAPGGKSTLVRSLLPEGSLLVANEVMRNRVQILAENLTKWGHPDVVVTNNGSADFTPLTHFFDVILTDVPCSGEGMFRKDEVAINEWSPENVTLCWKRQQEIIADIWPSLRPGGLLIYSTCTYNTKEDEENVRWIAKEYGAEVLSIPTLAEWNITGNLLQGSDFPVYRFLPHRTNGEGFFLAAIRKPIALAAEEGVMSYKNKGGKKEKESKRKKDTAVASSKELLALAKGWLKDNDLFDLLLNGTQISALSKMHSADLALIKNQLRVVSSGVKMGEIKGRDLIPDHALAMSNALNNEAFDVCDIDYDLAISYLRKEAISLPETAPVGYLLLTYNSVPLGFVKNIGRRANNLYPQEWRIRSGYLPEDIRTVF